MRKSIVLLVLLAPMLCANDASSMQAVEDSTGVYLPNDFIQIRDTLRHGILMMKRAIDAKDQGDIEYYANWIDKLSPRLIVRSKELNQKLFENKQAIVELTELRRTKIHDEKDDEEDIAEIDEKLQVLLDKHDAIIDDMKYFMLFEDKPVRSDIPVLPPKYSNPAFTEETDSHHGKVQKPIIQSERNDKEIVLTAISGAFKNVEKAMSFDKYKDALVQAEKLCDIQDSYFFPDLDEAAKKIRDNLRAIVSSPASSSNRTVAAKRGITEFKALLSKHSQK